MTRSYRNLAKKAILALSISLGSFFVVLPVFATIPNDPNYSEQKAIWDQVGAPAAWDITTGTKRVVVAVIDTGMDSWHEDLRDNLWINPYEIPDNGIDDDRNGFTDDVNGWNFVENNNNVRPSVFDNTDDKEAVRHGTIISGLIGARGNNGLDGTGLSQRVSIMTLRAIKSTGSGSLKAVRDAVDYAVDNGADIISMSFVGEDYEQRLYDSMRKAYEKGIVIIVAAGNHESAGTSGDLDIKPEYPACFDKVEKKGKSWFITVGAVDADDKLSEFSEYGKCVDIMAPGEFLYSTERYSPQYGYPDQFGGPWFGTSFATPLVAGAAALIKAVHPEFTPSEIIDAILNSADNIDSKNPGLTGKIGSGRLNAGKALAQAVGEPTTKILGSLYFLRSGELFKSDLNTGAYSAFTTLPQGKWYESYSYPQFTKEELVVLMQRNRTNYLDIFKSNGDHVRTISLPASLSGDSYNIGQSGGVYTVAGARFNKKTNKTEFRIARSSDKKIINRTVAGRVDIWSMDETGWVVIPKLQKNILTIYDLNGKKTGASLSGVTKILDLKAGAAGIAVLYLRGKAANFAYFDSSLGVWGNITLDGDAKSANRIKAFNDSIRSYLMPYNTGGGLFSVYRSDLTEAGSVRLPALNSTAR